MNTLRVIHTNSMQIRIVGDLLLKIDRLLVNVMTIIVLLLIPYATSGNQAISMVRINNLSYINHAPISILSDNDFIDQGWPGSGTKSNPYSIFNLLINGNDDYGIRVWNTTAHFEIRDCYVLGAYGPDLRNVTNGKIVASIFDECDFTLIWSRNCTVVENTIIGTSAEGGPGIAIWECEDCRIERNTIEESTRDGDGILVYGSQNIDIYDNDIHGQGFGLHVGESRNCVVLHNDIGENWLGLLTGADYNLSIHDNIIHDNTVGLTINNLTSSSVANNTFIHDGIEFEYWSNGWWHPNETDILFSNNSINGKQFGYFFGLAETNLAVEDYGQVVLINCTETVVSNPTISNTDVGIHLAYCDDCVVEEGEFHNNSLAGIELNFSGNSSIKENTISFNGEQGGIALIESDQNSISNNTIFNNTIGITLRYSMMNLIVNNSILYNSMSGIDLLGSSNNQIYANDIGGNTRNAYDDGANQWDNGVDQGNRWSDYDGSGIYQIGPYGTSDNYPSFLPGNWTNPQEPLNAMLIIGVISLIAVATIGVLVLIQKRRL